MALFRCRTFLCCLSLRIGVCLLTLIAMLVSGSGAAGSWLEVSWMTLHPLASRAKVAIIAQGGVFSVLFLLSCLGFISALGKQRGAVYIYSKFIFIHAPLIILSLVLTLYVDLRPESSDPKVVENCLNGSTSPIILQFCAQEGLSSVIKILPIALLGAAVLIQFYAWMVAISYGEELDISAIDRKLRVYNSSDYESSRRQSVDLESRR